MINCEYLVLLPKELLKIPPPRYLVPCTCPDCDKECYVAKSWIKEKQREDPNAIVKCLHCISALNWGKITNRPKHDG